MLSFASSHNSFVSFNYFIEVQLIYIVMLVSGVQHINPYIYVCIYIYMSYFRFFSLIGYYKIFRTVPCTIQWVLVVYLFYVQCVSSFQTPNLSSATTVHRLTEQLSVPTLATLVPTACFLCLWVYFCFVNSFIFLSASFFCSDSTYKPYHIIFVFTWLTSLSMIISGSLQPF